MRNDESWLLFEAEASGMKRPLYVVEIAAQRLRGYEPDGVRFRVLLHHEVVLDPGSLVLHGYTEDYLQRHGQEPRLARAFQCYLETGEAPPRPGEEGVQSGA